MGEIKTALEIALERTESVKSDKSSIDQFEAKQQGKKIANAYLAGELDIAEELKKAPAASRESLKKGIFGVLVTQITLPSPKESENTTSDSLKKIEKLGKGLAAVIKTNEFSAMFKQMMQIFSQYLQEAAQYEQMLKQQYAPKLRQKEEELSRRLGRDIHIDPLQDPEFIAFYNQHMNALKQNYEAIVEQAREETRKMFGSDV